MLVCSTDEEELERLCDRDLSCRGTARWPPKSPKVRSQQRGSHEHASTRAPKTTLELTHERPGLWKSPRDPIRC